MNTKNTFPINQVNVAAQNGSRLLRAKRVIAIAFSFCVGLAAAESGSANAQTCASPKADTVAAKCDLLLAAKIASQPKTSASVVTGWSRVIIRLAGGTLDGAREKSLTALGGDIYCRLPVIGSVAVQAPNRSLRQLAALPFVSHLSLDGSVRKNDEFTVGSSGADVAYNQYSLDGTGVGVAVLDSGIHGHPDLKTSDASASRIVAAVNFSAASSAIDDCGHGTHVAGIIAGNGAASSKAKNFRTFYGIARNANLINVRVLDSYGQGTVSGVISGINWVLKHKKTYNIRVLNLSLGHGVVDSYSNDPLCQAAEAAYQAGIVVVCAAGNSGRQYISTITGATNEGWGTSYGSIQSPGNDPYVITVGAMKAGSAGRPTDRIATYSSRGPSLIDDVLKPDLVAPGNRVISTLANGSYLDVLYSATNSLPISAYTSNNNDNSSTRYFYLSGTSMASPVVAGAAALLIQQDPTLTPDTVKARLMLSADKWTNADGTSDACTFGAGYLDIPAALNNYVVTGRSAMSPTVARDNLGRVIVDGSQAVWGNGRASAKAIWGIPGLVNLQSIWGSGALINAQATQGSQLLTTIMVNSQIVSGDQVLWGGSPGDPVAPSDPTTGGSASVDLSSAVIWGEQ